MSYRFRFAKAKKDNVLFVRDMTYAELVDFYKKNKPDMYNDYEDEEEFEPYHMFEQEEIYDFAQLPFLNELMKTAEKLFTKSETDAMFEHYNMYLCSKETFLTAIELMRKMIAENFKEMLSLPYEQLQMKVHNKMEEWQLMTEVLGVENEEKYNNMNEIHKPYNLKEDSRVIVQSWLYEYSIFELVRLYKEFDWENDVLLFYGW